MNRQALRVLEPDTVTVLTTHGCTARCRHCSANSAPERGEALSWAQLEPILAQLLSELRLRLVAFAGGEPLLLGETLLRAIRTCRAHGVRTRVVTNAYWATSRQAADRTVAALREAGLDELNISTDDYHLPYVSLQRVRHAFEAAAARRDFLSVAILNTCGPQSWLTPERLARALGQDERKLHMRWDVNGRSTEAEWQDGETVLLLSNRHILRLGRGVHGLAEDEVPPDPDLERAAAEIGGCPWAVRSAAISPRGHLVACCSIEAEGNEILDYGDLGRTPLADLLDRADGDLITNMIALIGPPRIRQILQRIAPEEVSFPRRHYQSYCDVCEDLVGIRQNRQALYRHQAAFADGVLAVREMLREYFGQPDGRVRMPPGTNLQVRFVLSDETNEEGRKDSGR